MAWDREPGVVALADGTEVACRGGIGRTGTALACIAQLAGVDGDHATAWIRSRYHPRAVEAPWQRRYVRRFARSPVRS